MIRKGLKMVANFAQQARNDEIIPYVILFNDRGFDDHFTPAVDKVMVKEILKEIKNYNQ